MNGSNNGQKQIDLLKTVAVRALMNVSGENRFCPVEKPTKFIVTLKPINKVPNKDPYLNFQPQFSECTCNTKSTARPKLTAEQKRVRSNNEALRGKTLLNAFRVLTNSKFISIDPKYNNRDNAVLSSFCEQLRLSGGGWRSRKADGKHVRQANAPTATSEDYNSKENPELDNQKLTVNERPMYEKHKDKKEALSRLEDKIFCILQRNGYKESLKKVPGEHRNVSNNQQYHKEKEIAPKKNEQKPRRRLPSKEQAESKQELQEAPPTPTCAEKTAGAREETFTNLESCAGTVKNKELTDEVPVCKYPAKPGTHSQPQPLQLPARHGSDVNVYPSKPKPAEVSGAILAQQCSRIRKLEQQITELHSELGKMKTEIIPPDDMLRCTALTSKLRELTALLADLKDRHSEAITAVVIAQKEASCRANSEPAVPAPQPAPHCKMRAEAIQTCFADIRKNQLSQTNASFGSDPFIDEATQASPPSTERETPKNMSSAADSSHTSSVTSAVLPCRHGTDEMPLKELPSFCPYCQCSEYPHCAYVERNLCGEIMTLLRHHSPSDVLLSMLLQPNNLYHVNISLTSTGEPLGCIYATERAINEAADADVFTRFLTFFIVDARISEQQKNKILAHTFEFFKS